MVYGVCGFFGPGGAGWPLDGSTATLADPFS